MVVKIEYSTAHTTPIRYIPIQYRLKKKKKKKKITLPDLILPN